MRFERDFLFSAIAGLPSYLQKDLDVKLDGNDAVVVLPTGRYRHLRVSADGYIMICFGYSYQQVFKVEHVRTICDTRKKVIWRRADA